MADQSDVARGRAVVERWQLLAEQRLDHLTELFETGRWRRYHTELEFLENVQEAKRAVDTWRGLLNAEAAADNRPIDLSWLGGNRNLAPRAPALFADEPVPRPFELPLTDAPPVAPLDALMAPAVDLARPDLGIDAVAETEVGAETENETWELPFDLALMQQRYPLLRAV